MAQSLSHLAPVARVLLALIFILSGFQKLADPAGMAAYIASGGLPGWLVWPTILVEIVGGAALVLGLQARVAALALAGFTLLAGLLFHFVPALGAEGMEAQMQMIMFWKNVSITGGLLFIVAHGAGAWALDNRDGAQPALA
ncbi:MAG: DoxX family protein [Maritimibacter sp.]|nr:DoxX family protein [Maritimibacter sp.]